MVSADEHGLTTCDYPHLDDNNVEAYRVFTLEGWLHPRF